MEPFDRVLLGLAYGALVILQAAGIWMVEGNNESLREAGCANSQAQLAVTQSLVFTEAPGEVSSTTRRALVNAAKVVDETVCSE